MDKLTSQEDYEHPLVNDFEIEDEEYRDEDYLLGFQDVMYERCFIGDVPFKIILESLETQFNDYINLDDKTNYVDIFYSQLEASYKYIEEDIGTDVDEYKNMLDRIRQEFYDFISQQFQQRLLITIMELDNDAFNKDRADYIIRKIYKYFILNARQNFFKLITNDILSKVKTVQLDDDNFQQLIETLLNEYSPMITSVGPLEFLRQTDGNDIAELLENNEISGNYLKKYSCKLYKNEDFEVEIINEIIMQQDNMEEK